MDYISKLNANEVTYVCDAISGKDFKKLFQKHSNEFTRICPGRVAKKLPDEKAVSIAVENSSKPLISSFINNTLKIWLTTIHDHIKECVSNGAQEEDALLRVLPECPFHSHLDMYFKLADIDITQDRLNLLQSAVNLLNSRSEEPTAATDDDGETDIDSASYTEEKESWEKEKASLIKQNADLRERAETAEACVTSAQGQLDSLSESGEKLMLELNDLRKRAQRRPNLGVSCANEAYPFTSICSVYTDYNGQSRLTRLFDISDERVLDEFSETFPIYSKLYANDGPSVDDFVGIWNWRTVPNISDPTKDFIETAYNKEYWPTEVVLLEGCETSKDIIEKLKAGIPLAVLSTHLVFACKGKQLNEYLGLLCSAQELCSDGGTVTIKDDVMSIPQYSFAQSDLIAYKSRFFLKYLDVGIPELILDVKDPLEIVKEVVLKRITWANAKQKGLVKAQYQQIRAFLSEIPTADICADIASQAGCSEERSKELFEEFRQRASEYITSGNIENDILRGIVQDSPEFVKRCKQMLTEEWGEEYKARIEAANAAVEKKSAEIRDKDEQLSVLNADYLDKKSQYKKIKVFLDEREQLAADVERKVEERISSAKRNAADFIAEQAFIQKDSQPTSVREEPQFLTGQILPQGGLTINASWEEELETICAELPEAGIAAKFVPALATFLYSAYLNRVPLMLMGPNGKAIADAFSAALFGETCAQLICEGNYSHSVLQRAEESNAQIVVIDNVFDAKWNYYINNYSQRSSKYLIAVNPFAEDLQIEPRGIVNYWIPVMTELFVDARPSCEFVGGKRSENFCVYTKENAKPYHNKLFQKLHLSSLSTKTLQQLLADLHSLNHNIQEEYDYLFSALPCAYVTNAMDTLRDHIEGKQLASDMKGILGAYLGDLE